MLKLEIGKKQEVFILLGSIIILAVMAIVLYQLISFKIQETPETTVPPVKTQASGKTYRKEISLNLITPSPTLEPSPTSLDLTPTSTFLAQAPEDIFSTSEASLTSSPTLTPTPTPTPTDIIVAQISPSPENNVEETSTSTPVKSLPESGYSYYYLLLFAAASFIIVFSLVI